MREYIIEIKNLSKAFKDIKVLNNINLKIERGDVIAELLLEQNDNINIENDYLKKCIFKEIGCTKVNRYLVLGIFNTYFHSKYKIDMSSIFKNGIFLISR